MKLAELTKKELEMLAEEAGTKVSYLIHVVNGRRKTSPKLSIKIEEVSGKKITRHDLRPDLWP